MSHNYSVLHYSSEFIDLCQAQMALLSQMMGATWSGVYLTEGLGAGEQAKTKLLPVVSYPTKEEIWQPKEDAPRLLTQADVANDTLLKIPDSSFGGNWDTELMVQPIQLVLPLMYNGVMIGLLVTRRENQQWTQQELQQIEPIAKTIAIGGLWELRQRWYQEQLNEQQTLETIERNRLDDFLHQFRNPLTAVRTFTKLLLRKLLPQDKHYQIAESLLRETTRLQDLLEEFVHQNKSNVQKKLIIPNAPLLSLPANLSKEDTPLEIGCFLSQEILLPLGISAQAIAQERDINLNVNIQPDLKPIEGNKRALTEVLSNLIDNALKYTPKGGKVEIRITQKEDYQGIEIADTGYGIPPEDQIHIFERHYRGVQAEGDIEGTGLGLAIAKELIEQMKGTIELISPNQLSTNKNLPGTTFIIWLPLA